MRACNPRTGETKAGGSPRAPGQPELCSKMTSQKDNKKLSLKLQMFVTSVQARFSRRPARPRVSCFPSAPVRASPSLLRGLCTAAPTPRARPAVALQAAPHFFWVLLQTTMLQEPEWGKTPKRQLSPLAIPSSCVKFQVTNCVLCMPGWRTYAPCESWICCFVWGCVFTVQNTVK